MCSPGVGVWFSLRGKTYQNNSVLVLEDIGEGDDALLCLTDQTACCSKTFTDALGSVKGNWFFPNGARVPSSIVNTTNDEQWDMYINDTINGKVCLCENSPRFNQSVSNKRYKLKISQGSMPRTPLVCHMLSTQIRTCPTQ